MSVRAVVAANANVGEIHHPDGRVELADTSAIERSPLYNEDLAPVPVALRNWTTYNYAALWISMAHCIPTYMMASGLMAAGMNWKQALFTILLGNTIVLIPILLNSHPGTRYGIPFPVFARAAYGTVGSNLPALMRAIVACGWFGIQAWIGGEAVHTLLGVLVPGWNGLLGAGIAGHAGTAWLSFLLFWGMNIAIIYRGMDLLRKVENWAAPFVLVMTALLLGWAVREAHGLGPLLAQPGRLNTTEAFLRVFWPSLTAMIGFWATLSLNMPDFTRFGRSQREQIIGQVVALPTTMSVFAAMGVLITSATVIIYGQAVWDPIQLAGKFKAPLVVAVSMFTVVVATLAVNIAANVVSPANDFANAMPRLIRFRTGGLITGILGILMQPWRLLADPSGYIFNWLLGYSGGLGSIAGVLIADYWIVQKRQLQLEDLYMTEGAYRYTRGWNPVAVVATLAGCALAWGGLVIPALRPLYDYAWFVGFGVAFAVYAVVMRGGPAVGRALLVLAVLLPSAALAAPPPVTDGTKALARVYTAYLGAIQHHDAGTARAFLAARKVSETASLTDDQLLTALNVLSPLTDVAPYDSRIEGDTATLIVGARAGENEATGIIGMVRERGAWKVLTVLYDLGGPPDASSLEQATTTGPPATLEAGEVGEAGESDAWAIADVRAVVAAEAGYQSLNNGAYDRLECVVQPADCVPGVPPGEMFLQKKRGVLTARKGYRPRFDAGPHFDAGAQASKTSLESYAYWMIPEPGRPGRTFCGDGSGVICTMSGPPPATTAGTCPGKAAGCAPLR
jgi:NCS1 family nucleobase:cation symporter-1